MVFAFDKSESFGIDKNAGEVCPHLTAADRCGIFALREDRGFKGCITYDCYGAGQRVTQEVFEGRSWRDDPALKALMGEALSVMRRIHELLLLLQSAKQFPLTGSEKAELVKWEQKLIPETAWTQAGLRAFPLDTTTRGVKTFLETLRHHVTSLATGHT
ncbi:hypothetical protein [Roseibium sp. MMSF_3544]|uniref:hypothetical protein n=1 Tax=unclassified Roseibium TaxID=2629323 RepID=UPI00273D44AA|nr:hypothetical protein [Roseibium sp. MMSF_3544]